MMRKDVVVVGAGPAGSLAAREVARAGASVLLVDRSEFPRAKVCGGCLNAGSLDILASVDLADLPDRLGAQTLHTLVLSAGARSVRLALEGSRAVSRLALDLALVDAARAEGVEFWSGRRAALGDVGEHHRVVRISNADTDVQVRASVVLDATGLGSGLVGPEAPPSEVAERSRIGLGASFVDAGYPVRPGELHMVVGPRGYVGIVRVESGVLNVAAAVDPSLLRGARPHRVIMDLLSSIGLPPLAEPTSGWRGTPTLTRSAGALGAHRLLRLGDAAGYVEPFTGEGMCWALSGASVAAPLALSGAVRWDGALLQEWQTFHRAALARSKRLCRILVPALRRTWMVDGALAVLGVAPGLAAPFVRRAARAPARVWWT